MIRTYQDERVSNKWVALIFSTHALSSLTLSTYTVRIIFNLLPTRLSNKQSHSALRFISLNTLALAAKKRRKRSCAVPVLTEQPLQQQQKQHQNVS